MSRPRIIAAVLLFLSVILSVRCSSKFAHGERAYNRYCADCHMEDGKGVGEIYPSLLKSGHISDPRVLTCIIKYGYNDTSTVMQMNAIEGISDIDITNIINYMTNDLMRKEGEVLIQNIQDHINNCEPKPVQ